MATVTTPPKRPKEPPVFNLPNQLTAARLVLGIVLFVLIVFQCWIWSIIVFAVAALTDYLDGYFARRQGLTSTLGRNLDPLVDKLVMSGAYIFLLPNEKSGLAAWMVTVVVGRELVITSLRSFMEGHGASFGADWLGKIKMGLQCAALFGIFVFLCVLQNSDAGIPSLALQACIDFLRIVRDALLYAMLAVTALSGIQYLWKAFAFLTTD